MRKAFIALSLVLSAMAGVAACSSSSNNGGSGGGTGCPGPGSCAAMDQCVQAHCESKLQACASPCSAMISCENKCGCSNTSCIGNCGQQMTQACSSCYQDVTTCVQQNCANVSCGTGGTGGSGGSGGSNGTGGTPGVDGGGATCADLAACCAQLPAADQQSCNSIVSNGNDSVCGQALSGFKAGGLCH